MILSLLIPTIPERQGKLSRLLSNLYGQLSTLYDIHPSLGIVEILIDDSKKFLEGGLSIGEKRNALVQRAAGKYLCFLDDDDQVTPNYLEQIVRMCDGKDIVTFRTLIKNDHYWGLINMSLETKENAEVNPLGIIPRTPWHICPVLSEIAKSETFSNLNHNEDWDWMQRVLSKVKSENHTDMILTQYNHSESGSEADKIVKVKKENMKSILLSLAVDGREKYSEMSIGLEKSAAEFWKHDFMFYKSFPEWCTPHSVIPYKFKIDLIRKAKDEGYTKIFWLDSSIRISGDIDSLLNESGIMAFDNLGHPLKNYISDKAVANLNISAADLPKIPQTWGGALGFDFSKAKACEIFEEWALQSTIGSFETSGSSREGFVNHRHDQAVISALLWKHKIDLLPYGNIVAACHAKEPFEYGNNFKLIYGNI